MNIGITINLGSRCLENTCLHSFCKPQTIDGPEHGGLHRLDGVVLVVRRGRRAGQIINPINLKLKGIDHIVADKFESGISHEMLDVRLATGEKVIQTNDIISLFDESVAEMGAEKPGSSGNQDTHKNKKG